MESRKETEGMASRSALYGPFAEIAIEWTETSPQPRFPARLELTKIIFLEGVETWPFNVVYKDKAKDFPRHEGIWPKFISLHFVITGFWLPKAPCHSKTDGVSDIHMLILDTAILMAVLVWNSLAAFRQTQSTFSCALPSCQLNRYPLREAASRPKGLVITVYHHGVSDIHFSLLRRIVLIR